MLKSFLIFIVSTFVLATVSAFSLNPFWCKGVALNSTGQVLPNTSLTVIVTIENSGGVLYQETHSGVPTDQFAVFTVEVGTGTVNSGALAGISATADTRIKLQAGGVLSMVSGLSDVLTSFLNSGTSDWSLEGNAGTTPGTDFIGTTDNVDLVFKVNNTEAGRINNDLNNTSLGYQSLEANTSGEENTSIGSNAMYNNTEGYYNVAVGYQALFNNTDADYNVAIGPLNLYENTSGHHNSSVGFAALTQNTTGYLNTANGYAALFSNTTGSNNTGIGYWSDVTAGDLTNVTVIGALARGTASNQVVLGDDNVTTFYCDGAYAGTTTIQPNMYVASDGQIMRSITLDRTFNNLTVNGNTIIGSDAADNLTVNALIASSLVPDGTTRDLGTDANRWGDLFLSGASLHIGTSAANEGVIGWNGSAVSFSKPIYITGTPGAPYDLVLQGDANIIGQTMTDGLLNDGTFTQNGTIDIQGYIHNTDAGVFNGRVYINDAFEVVGPAYFNSIINGTITHANNLNGGAAGSVPYQTAANTTAMLGLGTAGQVMRVNAGATAPEWVTISTIETDPVWTAAEPNYANLGQAETITANWTNTANPWEDNEVANNLTINGGTITNTTITGGNVTANNIESGTIFDDDVNVNAEIAVSKLGHGTAGYILTTDGTNVTWSAPSSSGWGLTGNSGTTAGTNFIGTTDDAELQLDVRNAGTVEQSLRINTNQAIYRESAISGITAGNTRGQHAVDLQIYRSTATEIAGGVASTVGGGISNTSSGQMSTVSGGAYNTSSGYVSTIGGGVFNVSSNMYSAVGGGSDNQATGRYSSICGGSYAVANKYGQNAQASGRFASNGDAQTSVFVARTMTEFDGWATLFLDGSTESLLIPNNATWSFRIIIVGKQWGSTTNGAGYQITGVVTNNGGTAVLLGTPTVTTLYESNTVYDAQVTVIGAYLIAQVYASTDIIRWVARIETAEITW